MRDNNQHQVSGKDYYQQISPTGGTARADNNIVPDLPENSPPPPRGEIHEESSRWVRIYKIFQKKPPAGLLNDPFNKIFQTKKNLRVDLRSLLQIIYDIGTEFLIFHCFATKMLFLFCKSVIPVRFCTIFPLHSCAGIKTRFKALLKT